MRNLFTVLAKLMGVLLLYLILESVQNIAAAAVILWGGMPQSNLILKAYLFVPFVQPVLGLVFAWLLLFKTQWLAGVLRIPEGEIAGDGDVDHRVLLDVGIKLIGLFMAASALPDVVRTTMIVMEKYPYELSDVGAADTYGLIGSIVALLLGIFLMLQSGLVARVISREKLLDSSAVTDKQA